MSHVQPSTRAPRRAGRTVLVAGLLVVLLVIVGGLYVGGRKLVDAFGADDGDYAGTGSGRVVVQIHSGDSAADIAATLLSDGVVKSVAAFNKAASADTKSRGLQPGFYALHAKMSGQEALALLLDKASRVAGRVTVPEGLALDKVLAKLSSGTQVPEKDLLAAVGNPAVLGLPSYAKNRPEGFLFPSTYDVAPGTGAVDVLKMMTQKFSEEAATVDLVRGAAALHMTPYDVVTVASIVEAETPLDADRPKVARAVYNRLARGMRLQLDSTVNYVRAERAARLSLQDIQVESPYNTYNNAGLPPTPIDSPGVKALEAALHPATGDYVYFITIDKQGHSLFTNSYQEFLAAKAKAQKAGVY